MPATSRYVYWKKEDKNDRWKSMEDTPENRAWAVSQGAMFFTNCSTLGQPAPYASIEDEDPLNLAPVRVGDLVFDLDSQDPDLALQDLRTLVARLQDDHGVSPAQLQYFFTGQKGFHLIIPAPIIGSQDGDQFLPLAYKQLAKDLAQDLSTWDRSLYCMGRGKMFRIPNVQRSNGFHKIPLHPNDLDPDFGATISDMQERAASPQTAPAVSPPALSQSLNALYTQYLDRARSELLTRGAPVILTDEQAEILKAQLPPCVNTLLAQTEYTDNNEKQNFNALCAYILVPFFKRIGKSLDEAEHVCADWLHDFTGSSTYTSPRARLDHFRSAWRDAAKYQFKCSITQGFGFKSGCGECPIHLQEAQQEFDSVLPEPQNDPSDQTPRSPGGHFRLCRATDINPASIKPRPWVLGHRYLAGFITLTVARGGASKSTLTIMEALAISSGKPITGDPVHKQGPTWVFNTEDPEDELERRIYAAAAHHGITPTDLTYTSGLSNPLVLVKRDPRGNLQVVGVHVKEMIDTIRANNFVHIVIDPFVRTHQVNENDNMEIDKVVQQLTIIAQATGVSISLVHHTRKMNGQGGAGDAEHARGASSLLAASRIAHTVTQMSKAEGEDFGVDPAFYIRLDDAKGNFSAPGSQITWFKRTGFSLPNGDDVGVLEAVKLEPVVKEEAGDMFQDQLIQAVANKVLVGSPVTISSLATRLPKEDPAIFPGKKPPVHRTVMTKIRATFLSHKEVNGVIYRVGKPVLEVKGASNPECIIAEKRTDNPKLEVVEVTKAEENQDVE
jgi:hypothetical protein